MTGQLALDDRWTARSPARTDKGALCAACQSREARYGFREGDPQVQVELDRPRTLCFECFRGEIARRQEAAQAVQGRLPLEQALDALSRRRRRAQIAARRALAVSGF
jgi:hypothetical protein